MSNHKIINQLLNDVERFYPVGLNIANEDSEGFQMLEEIVLEKVNGFNGKMLEFKTQAFSLFNNIQTEFKTNKVVNEYYVLFPNLSISVELNDESLPNNVKNVTYLRLKLSLITKHFTIFFEDMSWEREISHDDDLILTRTLSTLNSLDKQPSVIGKMKKIVHENFPDYNFVGHKLLFDHKLSNAVPVGHTDIIADYYPLYAFLFDLWVDFGKTGIID